MTPTQLAETLLNGDPEGRAAAAQALASLGPDARPAAVALVGSAGDPDAGAWCVAALEEMGPPSPGDVDRLTPLLKSNDETTAYWAATLLGRLEGDAAPAVTELMFAATIEGPLVVRERAVWALGKIGPAAASARPTLQFLTLAEHPRLARLATQALESIGGS